MELVGTTVTRTFYTEVNRVMTSTASTKIERKQPFCRGGYLSYMEHMWWISYAEKSFMEGKTFIFYIQVLVHAYFTKKWFFKKWENGRF